MKYYDLLANAYYDGLLDPAAAKSFEELETERLFGIKDTGDRVVKKTYTNEDIFEYEPDEPEPARTEPPKQNQPYYSGNTPGYQLYGQPVRLAADMSGTHADMYSGWRSAEKQSVQPYSPIPPLTQDLSVYEELKQKYPLNDPMIYSRPAVDLAKSLSWDINNAGREYGVPPEAVVGATADEKTRYDYPHLKGWNIFQDKTSQTLLPYSHIKKYAEENPDESTRKRFMIKPTTWDIGSYNINAATGYEVFQKHVLDPKADGMIKNITMQGLPENATDEQKWNSFRDNCLLNDKGGVYVAAAVLKEYDRILRPYMRNLSPEEQAALLVTAYKQGPDAMIANYNKRIQGELESSGGVNSGMSPGEGRAIYYNAPEIQDTLEWGEGQVRRKYNDFMRNNYDPVWGKMFRR